MKSLNPVRWGGLAAVLAGALLLVSDFLEFFVLGFGSFGANATAGEYAFVAGFFLLTALLCLLGLVGLYAGHAEAAGRLGLFAFLVAFVGTTLATGVFWAQEFFAPLVAGVDPEALDSGRAEWLNLGFAASFFLFVLGWVLFGASTLRARVHPRWAAVLLMVGAVLVVFPLPASSVVFGAAVIWLGLSLFTGKG